MKLVYLTEKCNVIVNTENEKDVLTRLVRDHKISEAKINGVYIYLCSDPLGRPDVENNKVRVLLKYMDKNHKFIEEMTWVDITYTMIQLNYAEVSSEIDGNFSYIDWEQEYMTMSICEAPNQHNSRIQFRFCSIPKLDSRETVLYGEENPRVDNVGLNGNLFTAFLRSKFSNKNRLKLTINLAEPLDSQVVAY